MVSVGITGGIGSGKSYVCHMLEEWGYPVYHTDDEAKRLMTEDEQLKDALRYVIGDDTYDAEGRLNKTVVASYLFASEEHAEQVNRLVHPCVKQDFLSWRDRQSADVVFMESAILFESHFDDVVDRIVFVSAPDDIRIERTIRRDRTTREKVEERIRRQWPQQQIADRSDYVIVNDGTNDLEQSLRQVLEQILNSKS